MACIYLAITAESSTSPGRRMSWVASQAISSLSSEGNGAVVWFFGGSRLRNSGLLMRISDIATKLALASNVATVILEVSFGLISASSQLRTGYCQATQALP